MNKYIRKSGIFMARVGLFLLSMIVKYLPKKNWSVFGCYGNKYQDNSMYLFKYLNKKNIKNIYWISGNRSLITELKVSGVNAEYRWSLKGIVICSLANQAFYNSYVSDINTYLLKGAKKINLWHGTPLKLIEYDINTGYLARRYNARNIFLDAYNKIMYPHNFIKPDFMLSPSTMVRDRLSRAFRLSIDKFIFSGYPRTDYYKSSSIIKKRQVLYMPTWRDNGSIDYIKSLDFGKLNNALIENDYHFHIKLHPNVDVNLLKINNYSNIALLEPGFNVYKAINQYTYLITDYSSIAIDALTCDVDVILNHNDIEDYRQNSRDFYDMDDFSYFTIINDFEEILDFIKFDRINDEDKLMKTKNKNRYWECDENSLTLLMNKFFK